MSIGNGTNGISEKKSLHCSRENTPAMKKTAVIDVDNTLWPFCDAFYPELKALHASFAPIDQWTTFDFWKQYCSEQEFIAAINSIHRDQDNDRYQPYSEARDFLPSLKERGFHVDRAKP